MMLWSIIEDDSSFAGYYTDDPSLVKKNILLDLKTSSLQEVLEIIGSLSEKDIIVSLNYSYDNLELLKELKKLGIRTCLSFSEKNIIKMCYVFDNNFDYILLKFYEKEFSEKLYKMRNSLSRPTRIIHMLEDYSEIENSDIVIVHSNDVR